MFHKAIDINLLDGTSLELTFDSGEVIKVDISNLFDEFPALLPLADRSLFEQARLEGGYGIRWNDYIDFDVESLYRIGTIVRSENVSASVAAANAVLAARCNADITQAELSRLTGIDQSDISKIERGTANPSVRTLNRIAKALGCRLTITIE